MSVLINGMEMPPNCYRCPFCDYVSGRCDAARENPYTPESRYEKRADFCPLVPVPPHGRLIDADALLSAYEGDLWLTARTDYAEGLRDVATDIKQAPTTIEAEDEDN